MRTVRNGFVLLPPRREDRGLESYGRIAAAKIYQHRRRRNSVVIIIAATLMEYKKQERALLYCISCYQLLERTSSSSILSTAASSQYKQGGYLLNLLLTISSKYSIDIYFKQECIIINSVSRPYYFSFCVLKTRQKRLQNPSKKASKIILRSIRAS